MQTHSKPPVGVKQDLAPMDEKFVSNFLDQYKMFVEMTDRLSARRVLINNSFITMMGAGAFIFSSAPKFFEGEKNMGSNLAVYFQFGVALGCVFLALMWHATILFHRRLARAKFQVIHEMEDHLPAKPYQLEWQYMRGADGGPVANLISLTRIEMIVPILAGIVALCGCIYSAVKIYYIYA